MFVQNDLGKDQAGKDAWGIYAAIFSLCFLGVSLADLGINQYLTKYIANNKETDHNISRNAFGIKTLSTVIFPFIMLGVGYGLGYEWKWLKLLLIIATMHSLVQFFGYFRAQIQGKQLFHIDAMTSNLDKVLLILITLVLIYTTLNIWTFAMGTLLSALLTCIVLLFISIKFDLFQKPKLDKKTAFSILKKGLPFAFITLVYTINERVDQVMVERLSNNGYGYTDAPIYAAAYRLVSAVMMYLWIVLPMFFAKFAHHETDLNGRAKLLKIGTVIVFVPVTFISVLSIFHGSFLFEFAFNNYTAAETDAMQSVFSILCFTLLLQGMFAILSTLLTSTGHEKYITKLVIVSVAFNLISNFYFIPIYGAYAAAWTTFGSAAIVVIGYIGFILKNNIIKLPLSTWLKLLIITGTSFTAYYLGNNHSVTISLIAGSLTFTLLLLILRPIKLKEIKNIG